MAQGIVEEQKIFLLLPLTFMNHSGVVVKEIVRRKKISLENILVVCDDINLKFGELRLRASGSDGGHNGLNSLIGYLHVQEFARLRFGIGRPAQKEEVVDYVLSEFEGHEKQQLVHLIGEAVDCCMTWIKKGTTPMMNQFNNKRKSNE